MIYYVIMFYMSIMIIFLMVLFMFLMVNYLSIYMEFEIMNFMSMKIELLILFDWVSILFISVVMLISLMVILYSLEYLMEDLNLDRFMKLILMFILSMILMILSPNMLSILIGWDGLGMVSYCLVIYYQSKNSFNSGMITVMTNRLGDIMILMSLGLVVSEGSWNFMFYSKINKLILLMLMISAFTKSAQIPFSSWLPMAMAAPTPVSSLVHSSTLVTAGVYLLIRLNYLFYTNLINLMMVLSVVTMFMAGLGANLEVDFKKIIALSTLSQLSIMIFCLSMKIVEVSFFHLLTHAMFKSLLFLCAGVVIHNMFGNQDIRYISMTLINLPLVSLMFNCSSLSLCGIPFMSGFFSKDLILEMFLMSNFNKFIFIILFISMGLTISYTFRLMYYSFINISQLNIYMKYFMCLSKMGISMYLLFFMSISLGSFLSWMMFSMKNYIYLTINMKLLIYMFMMLGGGVNFFLKNLYFKYNLYKHCIFLNKMFLMMWFLSMLYMSWVPDILKVSDYLMKKMDLGWLEYLTKSLMFFYIKKLFSYEFLNFNYMILIIMIGVYLFIMMF